MNVFELTRKLIDVPSVTGDELAVGQFLSSYLEQLGFVVERQEAAPDRFNVIATTGAPPRVVFSTHMDTVPPFIESREDEEFIMVADRATPKASSRRRSLQRSVCVKRV